MARFGSRFFPIPDLRSPISGQKDVGRLEVAVQNAMLVRVMDGPRDLGHEAGGAPRLIEQPFDSFGQTAAFD